MSDGLDPDVNNYNNVLQQQTKSSLEDNSMKVNQENQDQFILNPHLQSGLETHPDVNNYNNVLQQQTKSSLEDNNMKVNQENQDQDQFILNPHLQSEQTMIDNEDDEVQFLGTKPGPPSFVPIYSDMPLIPNYYHPRNQSASACNQFESNQSNADASHYNQGQDQNLFYNPIFKNPNYYLYFPHQQQQQRPSLSSSCNQEQNIRNFGEVLTDNSNNNNTSPNVITVRNQDFYDTDLSGIENSLSSKDLHHQESAKTKTNRYKPYHQIHTVLPPWIKPIKLPLKKKKHTPLDIEFLPDHKFNINHFVKLVKKREERNNRLIIPNRRPCRILKKNQAKVNLFDGTDLYSEIELGKSYRNKFDKNYELIQESLRKVEEERIINQQKGTTSNSAVASPTDDDENKLNEDNVEEEGLDDTDANGTVEDRSGHYDHPYVDIPLLY